MSRHKKTNFEDALENGLSERSLERFLKQHRQQARLLEISISENLSKINDDGPNKMVKEQSWKQGESRAHKQKLRTATCSDTLDKIVELQVASKDLLMEIRTEYEKFINVLSQGYFQFHSLQDEVKRSKTDPISYLLLQKRRKELENRIEVLKENSKRIASQIQKTKEQLSSSKTEERLKQDKNDKSQSRLTNDQYQNHSVLDKMPVTAATDLGKLVRYSVKLENKIQKLKESLRLQYTNKSSLEDLKDQLSKKENIQYHLLLHNARLRERYENLRSAAESLREAEAEYKEKPSTMAGLVSKALEDHRKASPDQIAFQNYTATRIIEDDDPTKKREAENILEYMDTFNDMINAKLYEEAARHAANSPKGVLRSYEIMKMFNEIKSTDNGKSPALMYCEALMSTTGNAEKMSGGLSCEVIKCSLKSGLLGLASHWLSKNCLTYSLPMGNSLLEFCQCGGKCQCGSLDLAKEVFESLGAYRQASLCLLSTGKIYQLIQYGQNHKFNVDDYVYLCKKFPTTKLLLFLMSAHIEDQIPGLISFPTAINTLLKSKNATVLSEILQEVYKNGLLEITGEKKTLTELLLAEKKSDGMSKSKWEELVEFCTASSLEEIGIEIMSILAVREAIDSAAYKYLMDYIS